MIRFLIEYSLPLGEKDVQPVTWGMESDGVSFSNRAQALEEQGRYTSFSIDDFFIQSV
jgi:hypothetical protein